MERAQRVVDSKAKPPGSLGRLEEWAVRLAALRTCDSGADAADASSPTPPLLVDRAGLFVFCADHGVVSGRDVGESVSAYPQAVSAKIFDALVCGGAAGAVLAQANGVAAMYVVDVGLAAPGREATVSRLGDMAVEVWDRKVREATHDFTRGAAMSAGDCDRAMQVGAAAIRHAVRQYGVQVACLGEVGIGNTTSASALVAALTGAGAEAVCGRGTGLDDAGVARKVRAVREALRRNGLCEQPGRPAAGAALEALRCVGGFEVAALVGAMVECGRARTPVLVDGFIACAAALAAAQLDPSVRQCLFFSHLSEEAGGMRAALRAMDALEAPVLHMRFRLGEGTGAVLALPILRCAAAMYERMMTLEQAMQLPAPVPKAPQGPGSARVVSTDEVAARGTGTSEAGVDTYDGSAFSELRVFFTAVMFLTRLRCPSFADHHPAFVVRSMAYYPLVGAVVGAFAASFLLLARALAGGSAAAGALGAAAASVWLTGCFHEDGLADVLDGFGGGWGRQQILRIMQDSRIGTYALVGTTLWLGMKVTLLAQLDDPWLAARCVLAAQSAARFVILPMVRTYPYLVDAGDPKGALYNRVADEQRLLTPTRVLAGAAFAAAAVTAATGQPLLALTALLVLVAIAMVAGAYGVSVIGGVIGDFLGATICIAEVAVYALLVAHFRGGGVTGIAWADATPAIVTVILLWAYTKLASRI